MFKITDRKDVQSAYKKEARSLISNVRKGLCRLNYKLRTTNYKLQLFSLFRHAHTLKGISGTCGHYEIEEAAKSIEEIFRAAKDGKREIGAKDKVAIKKNLKVCEKLLR